MMSLCCVESGAVEKARCAADEVGRQFASPKCYQWTCTESETDVVEESCRFGEEIR